MTCVLCCNFYTDIIPIIMILAYKFHDLLLLLGKSSIIFVNQGSTFPSVMEGLYLSQSVL